MMNSLGRKVLVASLGALALLFGCYAVLSMDLAKWNRASAHVMRDYQRAMLDGQFHAALTRAVGESAAYALTGNRDYENDANEALKSAHEALGKLRQINERVPPDAGHAVHQAFLERQQHLLRLMESGLRQASALLAAPGSAAGGVSPADTVGSMYAYQAEADGLWSAIVAHHGAELLQNEQSLGDQSRRAQWLTLASMAALALVAGVLIHYVRRRIVQPLTALARLTGQVAAGDLTGRADVTRGDEIGQLQRSFNGMVDDLEKQRSELAALLDSLGRSRDAAQSANLAKTRFLANVSHEIRTPLHGVLVSLDLMHETSPDAEQRELADTARASARTLLRMFNDLLDFSRIEAGNLPLEMVNFEPRQLLARLLDLHGRRALDKGLALHCQVADDVPASLCGDALRVGQVLVNLLDNAIKFTDSGRIDVQVSVVPAPQADTAAVPVPQPTAWLRFGVTDTGIGVPDADAQKIFQPFYQAEQALSHGQDGIGLGLGIARQLALRMGGELGFESQLGKGSTFWFTVPQRLEADCETTMSQEPARARQFPSGGAVLLVEDHRDIREVIARSLQRRGLSVTTAENGLIAVELAATQHFDMIFMDCRMPVMDGFQATLAIRAMHGGRAQVPIVALTAYGLTEPKQRYLDAGFDDLVVKPCTLQDLESALYRWLVPRQEGGAPPAATPTAS